mmetsp:Transcript_33764/g.44553  ORF Transcript_33764/g.44553 Transcript_33764/m.44553 type:complete len:96 (-) Transcript_33764:302-589(-)
MGKLLGIKDPIAAISSSQTVYPEKADLDYKSIPTFSLENWVADAGISMKETADLPANFKQQELKKTFSVPESNKFDSDGAYGMKMSGPIQVFDIE